MQSHSGSVKRRPALASEDALFVVSHAGVKPSNQILRGTAVRLLTGSHKVLTMLNRFGHCFNQHAVEEIETELAYALIETQLALPDGAFLR